jgi:hypothetical protein
MNLRHLAVALCAAVITGCGLFSEVSDSERAASAALEDARTQEEQGHIEEAAQAYGIIAREFSSSVVAVTAIRKAALLNASAANPARNDSVARAWLRVYLSKDITPGERETASLLLDRIAFSGELLQRLRRQEVRGDSLTAQLREQALLMRNQGQAIEALRKELYKTTEELRKLKDIDEQTSRRRPQTGSR